MGSKHKRTAPERLTAWRHKNELTQAEASLRLGVTQATLCRWERGKRSPPLAYAVLIEKLAGIPVSDWISPPTAAAQKRGAKRAS